IGAACASSFVEPADLEPYRPDWATVYADACKPDGAGAPEIAIGQGQDAFAPIEDGGPILLEKGPQGGLHVWLAIRMRNLHQDGSITRVSAIDPDQGTAYDDIAVRFGY